MLRLACLFILLCSTVHAQSDKIRVMVLDIGVAPIKTIRPYLEPGWEKRKVHYTINRNLDHGTAVASVILYGDINRRPTPVCKEVEIVSCKYRTANREGDAITNEIRCLKQAYSENIHVVNFSSVGSIQYDAEKEWITKLRSRGVSYITAAGNRGVDISESDAWPAKYAITHPELGVVAVANMTYKGNRNNGSNWFPGVIYEYGTDIGVHTANGVMSMNGTSMAAAMYTHNLLLSLCADLKTRHIKK